MTDRRAVLQRLHDLMVTGSANETLTYLLANDIVPNERTAAIFMQHADFSDDTNSIVSYMIFDELLRLNAPLTPYRLGISPLIAAVNVAPFAVVEKLVERLDPRGVRYSAPDGNTPLHYAVGLWRSDVVILLASHGADVYARNETATVPVDVTEPLLLPERWKVRYHYRSRRPLGDFYDTLHVTKQIRSHDADVTNLALLEHTHIGSVMLNARVVAAVGEHLVTRPKARVSDVNNFAVLEALSLDGASLNGRCLLSVGEYVFGRPRIAAPVLDNLVSLRRVAFDIVSLGATVLKEAGDYAVQRKLFPYVARAGDNAGANVEVDPEADDPEEEEEEDPNARVNDVRVMRARFAGAIDRRMEADGYGPLPGEDNAQIAEGRHEER